jgi:hypothetical protein
MSSDNTQKRPDAPPAARETTPASDLQPANTGTPAGGNGGRGTAASSVMKQTSKTPQETGSDAAKP